MANAESRAETPVRKSKIVVVVSIGPFPSALDMQGVASQLGVTHHKRLGYNLPP